MESTEATETMSHEAAEALKLVDRIYTRLNARRPEIDKFEDYYNGKQPLSFATAEWRKANSQRYEGFSDNWCAPIVAAESERIRYTGITVPNAKTGSKWLDEQWQRNEMDMQSSQGFVTTLTTSRSFVIVWGDRRTEEPVVTWEHPSNVEIEYDWANPLIRTAALKTWVDQEDEYATLYTPEYIWKFERERTRPAIELESQAKQGRTGYSVYGGWEQRDVAGEPWPLVNPMGVVPVVEVPNRPTLKGDPLSEIQGAVAMQDFVNLMWQYLMLAADYASMPARVVMGATPPMMPILDSAGKVIGSKPVDMKELAEKRLFYAGDGTIGSWPAADLKVFTDVIDVAVGHIASQTRTPPTYLVSKTGMSNVNGEGLKASEIGLNKKTEEFWTYAGPALREVNRLIALAKGDEKLAQQVRLAKINHMNPEIRSEAQLADMLVKKKSIGYPLAYLMELDGIEPRDIPRILAMAQAESDAALSFGAHAALNSTMTGTNVSAG